MRLVVSIVVVAFALWTDLINASDVPHNSMRKRRHPGRTIVDSSIVEQNVTTRALQRRFDDARFTFYAAGLGACGKTNSPSDFIVALNSAQFSGGAHCFESITITVGGKSHSAQIVDECPGCPFAGLDFSTGLFDFFAPESVGVLTGSWNFGGSSAPPPPPSSPPPPPKPKTTTHAPPRPKTTQHSVTPTFSSPTTKPTSTESAITSVSVSASSSTRDTLRSASSTGTAASTASSTASSPPSIENIAQLYLAFIQIGSTISAGDPSAANAN